MAAAAARGRKPAPANRSRQQIQREKALQMAAQKNASPCLPPEQQLTKPPPREEPEPQPTAPAAAAAPAVRQEVQPKPSEIKPAPEEEIPAVKELAKQEVALLVCFHYCTYCWDFTTFG